MLRDITLGQYYPADSVIHKLDPRVKLFSTLIYIISLFCFRGVAALAIATVFLITVIKLSKVPFKFMVKGLKAIMILMLITAVFNLFLTPGEALVSVWRFTITKEGVTNAVLNMILVIVFHLGVAGVAIATIISQLISCILVLRCLYMTDSSYQLRFSRLCMKKFYLVQIFQVGIPAGVQSTVINISNALLQSSVNSFGSTAMAGYTAANNILGFLYASVNAVTQACMSFTSQNYGVGKYKRMDRVLLDCGILSFVIALVLGCGSYMFGGEILKIYTENPEVIRCGVEILSITTVPYFLCGIMDLFPGALRGMGHSGVPMILSIIGTVGTRIVWIFWIFPQHRSLYTLFISYPASWFITIVLQVVCFVFVRRTVHGQLKGTGKAA